MNSNQYISILLSSIFAVFLGHNLVPHHHHSEIVSVPVSSECPVEHGDHHEGDHDTDHHPIHCYAFNDVVFDKYSSPQIQPQAKVIQYMTVADSMTNPDAPVNAGISGYICLKIPDPAAWYVGARPLRGPPLFS